MGKLGQLLAHPTELRSALLLKYFRKPLFSTADTRASEDLTVCYRLLNLTSRSFAAVIMELHPELRNAVMLFYLILRALDTVEDDMSIAHDIKVPVLRQFHEKLATQDWSFNGNAPTEKDRAVLTEFPCILREFHKLDKRYQDVIVRITKEMGNGMADYILDEDFNLNGVATIKAYDLYCHYVAGLVGDGLTHLMCIAQFADAELENETELFESMGLFLQKTNIIRDYAEDIAEGRSFWPREVWELYAKKLPDFQLPENTQQGVFCINHLVLNALDHVRDVLTFLSCIHEQSTFQFCAIPQVMAIATLALVFNNPAVLKQNVKIRKGQTCSLILQSRSYRGCVDIFEYYLRDIRKQLNVEDPNYLKFNIHIAKIDQFIEEMYQDNLPAGVKPNETPIYLKVQKRAKYDTKAIKVQNDELYKFNVLMTVAVTAILALLVARAT